MREDLVIVAVALIIGYVVWNYLNRSVKRREPIMPCVPIKTELTDVTPLTRGPGYFIVMTLAFIVGAVAAIIAVCYIVYAFIKYPLESGVVVLGVLFLWGAFGLFTKPYPCKHGDGHTTCHECDKFYLEDE